MPTESKPKKIDQKKVHSSWQWTSREERTLVAGELAWRVVKFTFLFAAIALILFFLLPVDRQRPAYSRFYERMPPNIQSRVLDRMFQQHFPVSSYDEVLVSSASEDSDCCEAVIDTACNLAFGDGQERAKITAKCTPHFWNNCRAVAPDKRYFAQWLQNDGGDLAIGEAKAELAPNGAAVVVSSKIALYKQVRWEKLGRCENSKPAGRKATFVVDSVHDLN